MKRLREPERLAEVTAQDGAALAQAIRAGRIDGNRAQVERLAQRLASQLAVPATPAPAVTSAAGLSTGVKLGTVVLAGLIATALMLRVGVDPTPQRAMERGAAKPAISRDAPHAAVPVVAAPVTPPAAAPVLRQPPAPQAARSVRSSRSAPAAASQPAPERELSLLQRSQAALDGDPAAALAHAERHARDYPEGVFAQEREMLAIEALLKLRDKRAAVARAARFVRRFPDSAHVRRVRALLARFPVADATITGAASDSNAKQEP